MYRYESWTMKKAGVKILMLLNCVAVEDSWEYLEIKPINHNGSQSWIFIGRTDVNWSSNTLATWFEDLTHWKRPWCWERLRAGGEKANRGCDVCMASLTRDLSLSKLREVGKDREAWSAAVHGVTKSWTWLTEWITTKGPIKLWLSLECFPVLYYFL